jgi:hypothetical protein
MVGTLTTPTSATPLVTAWVTVRFNALARTARARVRSVARQKLTKKQRARQEKRRTKLVEKAAEVGLDYNVICDSCKRRQPMHKGPCWNCGGEVGVYA